MPALITHYLFGEEALNRGTCAGFLEPAAGRDGRRTAFDLGCQGPDPFFFAYTTPRGGSLRRLAHELHARKVSAAFEQLRLGLADLAPEERPLGRAFACGVLAHYALDRRAHAYVFAMEHALCGADPALADAHHETHALIEGEIDCGMLDLYRGLSTARFAPAGVLEGNAQVEQAAGRLMASVAREVYGIAARPGDYALALGNARTCYRLIEPYGSARSRKVAQLERMLRPHSLLESLAHRSDLGAAGNASMNAGGFEWESPWGGARSSEPFAAVFERALGEYPQVVEAFLNGGSMREVVARVNYDGQAMDAEETAAL